MVSLGACLRYQNSTCRGYFQATPRIIEAALSVSVSYAQLGCGRYNKGHRLNRPLAIGIFSVATAAAVGLERVRLTAAVASARSTSRALWGHFTQATSESSLTAAATMQQLQ